MQPKKKTNAQLPYGTMTQPSYVANVIPAQTQSGQPVAVIEPIDAPKNTTLFGWLGTFLVNNRNH